MTELVFDEWYGYLLPTQRNLYKKFGVSPADHDFLVYEFGEENRDMIVAAVRERSENGYYRREFV